MIICECKDRFMMVSQHEHAKISGEIAENWNEEYFVGIERKEDVILGIYQHDRGWIEPDAAPLWNDQEQKPYSFIDYPLESKVAYYKKGIDEVQEMNLYASLLCSLHYAAFFQHDNSSTGKQYMLEEQKRQQYLFKDLGIKRDTEILQHLNLLRFCDNLSLFICINKPGENEHPFFRNGIPQTFPFSNHKSIDTQWLDEATVSLSTYPLKNELQVQVKIKEVKKEKIKMAGLLEAYTNTPYSIRPVKFT